MHGKNELRPRESNKEGRLQVQNIWYTIQGEGPFFGRPAVFVRLTGCNLACTFCDTKWDDKGDKYLPVEVVVNLILVAAMGDGYRPDCNLVVLTGGEPARQDIWKMIYILVGMGKHVQVETAGTYWQDSLSMTGVTIVCSPKTKHVHPKIMEHCNHWKYVIQAGHTSVYDGLPAGCTQTITPEAIQKVFGKERYEEDLVNAPHLLANEPGQTPGLDVMVTGDQRFGSPARPPQRADVTVWLSPCNEGDPAVNRRNMVLVGQLCMKFGYRAQVQLHNLLELP